MLTFSVLAVIAVLTFPQQQKEQLVYKPMIERVAKYQSIEKSDSTIMFSKSLNNDDTVARPAPPPIEVKIVSDKKFDWKGTAAWGIGLINGVILLILNLKKLFNKTA
jgi:hypothetical protein